MPSNKDGCSRRAVEVGHWEGERNVEKGRRGWGRGMEGRRDRGEILEREVYERESE